MKCIKNVSSILMPLVITSLECIGTIGYAMELRNKKCTY